ncbi:MAG: FAD binding domain-containing protein [Candidatus Odinarchaeota archaeon]
MVRFDILTPENLTEALKIKNEYRGNIAILGAGTDIIPAERSKRTHFPRLVNIYNLDELKNIRKNGKCVEIGACVTHTEIADNETIREEFPVLREAVSRIACPQIRNRATIGGNVCNASPAGDGIGPLYTRDVSVSLTSVDGERKLPISKFITGPGQTSIADNEILTGIVIPKMKFTSSFYLTLRRRKAQSLNKVSLAFEAVTNREESGFEQIRLAYGAVSPTVVRAFNVEDILKGQKITAQLLERAKEETRKSVKPIDDVRSTAEYRQEMCAVLLERAISRAIDFQC